MPKGYPIKWTDEMIDYIHRNYKTKFKPVIAAEMTEKFGIKIKPDHIKSYMHSHGLVSGLNATFPKGNVPANKGKHQKPTGRTPENWFKKGQIPQNRAEVGVEVINGDGYIKVKIAQPKTWKLKHILVWEEAHGPIEKGKMITFLDGNPLNVELSNLREITMAENAQLNRLRRRSNNPEITDATISLVRLKLLANKKRKKE